MRFSDILDQYLDAKNDLNDLRKEWVGFGGDFNYFHSEDIEKVKEARDKLNETFEKVLDRIV